ncbi:MAG: 5'-methylthioadenosine/adenosylhomocysteine nucleosidase [Bryobacterales bacterium]|nr:5'-methylthioadenosine/adenosylhomocysteine nucleosidase [Bryobacterales bacterium]
MNLSLRTIALIFLVCSPQAAPAQAVIAVLGIAEEIAPFEKRLRDSREVAVQGYVFRLGVLNGRQVVVGRSGAGKVNAAIVTTLLIGRFEPSALLFSGTAGAVDQALRPGDVVIGASVAQHDVGLRTPRGLERRGLRNAVTRRLDPLLVPAPPRLLAAARRSAAELTLPPVRDAGTARAPAIVEGVIVTGDAFLTDVPLRDELRSSLNAAAVEMEGAAVVQACRQFNLECLVIRGITDRADGQALSSYRQFLPVSSENAAALTAAIAGKLETPPTPHR